MRRGFLGDVAGMFVLPLQIVVALFPISLRAQSQGPTPQGRPLTLKVSGFHAAYALKQGSDGKFATSVASQILDQSGLLSSTAAFLNQRLVTPRAVELLSRKCGVENAFYDPKASQIVLCDEMLWKMVSVFAGAQRDQSNLRQGFLGATLFILYHEVGHALIDLYGAPVFSRAAGEDEADALATYLLSIQDASHVALIGADAFGLLARSRNAGQRLAFWDEHSVHEQRYYNILCYLFGSDPGRYAYLVARGILPEQRARTCPADYAGIAQAARQVLGPHLRQ